MLTIQGPIKYSMKQINFNNIHTRSPKIISRNSRIPHSRFEFTTAGEVVGVINV